jgi:hypothetical protein
MFNSRNALQSNPTRLDGNGGLLRCHGCLSSAYRQLLSLTYGQPRGKPYDLKSRPSTMIESLTILHEHVIFGAVQCSGPSPARRPSAHCSQLTAHSSQPKLCSIFLSLKSRLSRSRITHQLSLSRHIE